MTPGVAWHEAEVEIPTTSGVLTGTLSLPVGLPRPAVMLIGGTFSDLRDGDADPRHRPDIPPHGMYRVLAHGLAAAGLAVLRFDRRGSGGSSGARPSRAEEIDDAAAAWRWLGTDPRVQGAAAMVGESAGAYVLCRLAGAGILPRAAVLQGALHRTISGLIEFNGRRARAFYERGPEAAGWMWEHARHEYESAVLLDATLEAISSGRLASVRARDDRIELDRSLEGLRYDLEFAPADQFAALTCPTLVLHGADDLNVPVEDALATLRSLREAGNRSAELVVLAGADHSMQSTPDDPEERLRERMTFASFLRPYHPRYPAVVVEHLRRIVDRGD
ncbi:MAG TPA: alpha/beta hydrolase [Candidatus Limnocylindrales bacterium]|nr:alpha/beta hydrolase [Candidatus Limnocylindrales bacterium]